MAICKYCEHENDCEDSSPSVLDCGTFETHVRYLIEQIDELSDRKLSSLIRVCDHITPLEQVPLFSTVIDFEKLMHIKACAIAIEEYRKIKA